MELKLVFQLFVLPSLRWFNRTFMELKLDAQTSVRPWMPGFNRTFMELKYFQNGTVTVAWQGLIVPLWN